MLNKLRVEEGKASELILIKIHHEQLVSGGEVCALAGELPVKVRHVLPVFLEYKIWLEMQSIGKIIIFIITTLTENIGFYFCVLINLFYRFQLNYFHFNWK